MHERAGVASRVVASSRLTLERARERRRVSQNLVVVPCHEVRERSGQLVISLCSSDDDGGGPDDEPEDDEPEDEVEGDDMSVLSVSVPVPRTNGFVGDLIKREIDSTARSPCEVVDLASDEADDPNDSEWENDDDVEMADAGSDESGFSSAAISDEEEEEEEEVVLSKTERPPLSPGSSRTASAKPSLLVPLSRSDRSDSEDDDRHRVRRVTRDIEDDPASPTHAAAHTHTPSNRWRVRRLDEVDAAFLLFYSIAETPSSTVLRLIVELVAASVGDPSEYMARFIRQVVWRKLNKSVETSMENERLLQSEWMKIVFEEKPPRHRRRWGPMSRLPLLTRPVQITVRSMQFAGDNAPRQNQSGVRGSSQRPHGSSTSLPRHTPKQPQRQANGNSAKTNSAPSSKKSAQKAPKQLATVKRPSPGLPIFSKASPTVLSTPPVSSPPFTPRKHRRRNGNVSPPPVTPRQIVQAKGAHGQSISHDLMEPLPADIRTLGENRSLPIDWDGDMMNRKYAAADREVPLEVDPLLHMTVDQLGNHIKSVRREGRVESFERIGEILTKLLTHPRNRDGIFNVPVDPVALNLPTYATVVKSPMDLGTIKSHLAEGVYLELEDFEADVRLVFNNAMLFNSEAHYVHINAEILLHLFEEAMQNERERRRKRNKPSNHICLTCRGHSCSMCYQQCLPFAPPHLQCSGGCGADIRKGSVYYATRDGTRVYCQKCKTRLERDGGTCDSSKRKSGDDDTEHFKSSQNVVESIPMASLIKHKCEIGVEPWVRCSECSKWLHQVCGLYNPVLGVHAREHKYMCPLCHWRRRRPPMALATILSPLSDDESSEARSPLFPEAPSPAASMDGTSGESSTSHHTNDDNIGASGHNIPSCELSEFIQAFLQRELRALGEHDAAKTLYVRAVALPNERMTMSEAVVRVFDDNCKALEQLQPLRAATETPKQRLPEQIEYLSRGLYLFQQHDGVDVCLFTLFAQEFGDACALEANRRSVYIAYLDSVRYLAPPSARTAAYHLIMQAYFDYLRLHGFHTVHLWSCPPQKRISYVFYCRPSFQKTPSAEHLRLWYKALLEKSQQRGIVTGWTTTYDRYFKPAGALNPPSASFPSSQPTPTSSGMATRGASVKTVDPNDLIWPAPQLPPLFDGDLIPSELDRVLGRIVARNDKAARAAKLSPYVGKSSVGATGGKRTTPTGDAVRIKIESGEEAPEAVQVDVKLREMFTKLEFAVQRLKNDLLVVDLRTEGETLMKPCRPEALVPMWCARVPRFFGSRFMFHQLCAHAGYQFDSLRRAKHSTMMVLHHYFNERAVAQANVFCRECCLLITHADFWWCSLCDRVAMCDACYTRVGREHAHPLRSSLMKSPPPPPCLTLDDVARDAFRRDFFLRAFPAERDALERCFDFLARARHYKRLVGRRDALLHLAQEIVATDLPVVADTINDADTAELLARIGRFVRGGRAPLNLFAGVEARLAARLSLDHFPRFLESDQFPRLCDALRSRRDLPLAELLVDVRRTQFLDQFLRETSPSSVGNLSFWVDVQTTFLPLLQVNLFSPALFDQVQRAVRRIFNQYCTDTSPLAASRLPESVRKETLARIMQLQGEPFSPPRYANLFRAAQDCVWQWLQSDVYPRFRASDVYVRLIVETEDLEADAQLRRLSEHVHVSMNPVSRRRSESVASSGSKSSGVAAIVIPILPSSSQATVASWSAQVETPRCKFARVVNLTVQSEQAEDAAPGEPIDWRKDDICSISFYSLVDHRAAGGSDTANPCIDEGAASPFSSLDVNYDLMCCVDSDASASESHPSYLNYCFSCASKVAPTSTISPTNSRSPYFPAPKPAIHNFVVPTACDEPLHGLCLTQWVYIETSGDDKDVSGDKYEGVWRLRCIALVGKKPFWSRGHQLMLKLAAIYVVDAREQDLEAAIRSTLIAKSSKPSSLKLNTRYSEFALQTSAQLADTPFESALRQVSTQTFLTMLGSVLVGKSIMMVSERTSALVLVGEALRRLLSPLKWKHFYLPFCPLPIARAIASLELFQEGGAPFIIGFDATLLVQKQRDAGVEQLHRLRNSIYNIQKAGLQLQLPTAGSTNDDDSTSSTYPPQFLQTQAVVVDLDADDIYVPERVDIPEFPQALVRSFEGLVSEAIRSPSITDADSFLFNPLGRQSPFIQMLDKAADNAPGDTDIDHYQAISNPLVPSADIGVRLAVLWFLEALLGDVVYHFCSLRSTLANNESAMPLGVAEEFIMFEVDSFLDAHIELGCREFFRQCFQSELFRDFLLAQHRQFSPIAASSKQTQSTNC